VVLQDDDTLLFSVVADLAQAPGQRRKHRVAPLGFEGVPAEHANQRRAEDEGHIDGRLVLFDLGPLKIVVASEATSHPQVADG